MENMQHFDDDRTGQPASAEIQMAVVRARNGGAWDRVGDRVDELCRPES